jgi:hypothetical protein
MPYENLLGDFNAKVGSEAIIKLTSLDGKIGNQIGHILTERDKGIQVQLYIQYSTVQYSTYS